MEESAQNAVCQFREAIAVSEEAFKSSKTPWSAILTLIKACDVLRHLRLNDLETLALAQQFIGRQIHTLRIHHMPSTGHLFSLVDVLVFATTAFELYEADDVQCPRCEQLWSEETELRRYENLIEPPYVDQETLYRSIRGMARRWHSFVYNSKPPETNINEFVDCLLRRWHFFSHFVVSTGGKEDYFTGNKNHVQDDVEVTQVWVNDCSSILGWLFGVVQIPEILTHTIGASGFIENPYVNPENVVSISQNVQMYCMQVLTAGLLRKLMQYLKNFIIHLGDIERKTTIIKSREITLSKSDILGTVTTSSTSNFITWWTLITGMEILELLKPSIVGQFLSNICYIWVFNNVVDSITNFNIIECGACQRDIYMSPRIALSGPTLMHWGNRIIVSNRRNVFIFDIAEKAAVKWLQLFKEDNWVFQMDDSSPRRKLENGEELLRFRDAEISISQVAM